jgi:hypothetical protein
MVFPKLYRQEKGGKDDQNVKKSSSPTGGKKTTTSRGVCGIADLREKAHVTGSTVGAPAASKSAPIATGEDVDDGGFKVR